MNRYRLTGSYGTFVIRREVDAVNQHAAFVSTGIMSTLEAAGWEVIKEPEGESWTVDVWDGACWVETDGGYG